MRTGHNILILFVFLLLVAAAAAFGAQFGPGAWYAALEKPDWNPPNWVFGPVWSVLYGLMAVSGWRLWLRREDRRARHGLLLWAAQWLLNALWSWLFFGLARPDLALVDIVLLFALLLAYVFRSWPVDRLAAWLFVPYAAWVGFASVLNAAIWLRN